MPGWKKAVISGIFWLLLVQQEGTPGGQVATTRGPAVGDLLSAVEFDLRQVGPFEELPKQRDELSALGVGPLAPVRPERLPGRLLPVEQPVRDPPNGLAPGLTLSARLEGGILEDLDDLVDGGLELIGGLAGGRP